MALMADLGTVEHLVAKGFIIAFLLYVQVLTSNDTFTANPEHIALFRYVNYILSTPVLPLTFSYNEYQNRFQSRKKKPRNHYSSEVSLVTLPRIELGLPP